MSYASSTAGTGSRRRAEVVRPRESERWRPLATLPVRLAGIALACAPLAAPASAQCGTVIHGAGPVPNNFGRNVAAHRGYVLVADPANLTISIYAPDGSGGWQVDGSLLCGFFTPTYGTAVALYARDCAGLADGQDSVQAYVSEPFVPSQSPFNYGTVLPLRKTKFGASCTFPGPVCPMPVQRPSLSDAARFGASLDVNDAGTLVVGAPGNDGVGGAYVYTNGMYAAPVDLRALVPGPLVPPEGFGTSVAIGDDWLMVGSSDPLFVMGGDDVCVFQRVGNDWIFFGVIPKADAGFGLDIALDGDTAFIRNGSFSIVYSEYRFAAGAWSTTSFIVGGTSLDLDGDVLVASGSGVARMICSVVSVRAFRRTAAGWSPITSLPGTIGGAPVAVDGDLIVVGSPAETDCCIPFGSCPDTQNGAVYVHELTYWQAGGTSAPFEAALNWTVGSPGLGMLLGGPGLAATCTLTSLTQQVVCSLTVEGNVPGTAEQRLRIAQGSELVASERVSIHDFGTLQLEGSSGGSVSIAAAAIAVHDRGRIEGHGELNALSLRLDPGSEILLDDGGAGLPAELTLDVQTFYQDGGIRLDQGGTLTIPNPFANDGAIFVDGGTTFIGNTLFSSAPFTNTGHDNYPDGGFLARNALVDVSDPGITNASTGYVELDGDCTLTTHIDNSGLVLVKGGAYTDMGFSDFFNSGQFVIGAGGRLDCFSYFVPLGSGGVLLGAGDCWEFDLGSGTYVPCAPTLGPLAPLPSGSGAGGTRTLDVETDVELSAGAVLDFGGGLIRLRGDFIAAIDDPAHLNLVGATLQFDGIGFFGAQELEVMASDAGPQTEFTDPAQFPVRVLHVGPNPAALKLVDDFDNSPGSEVLYAAHVILDAACELDLAGRTLYCARLDVDASATVTDSVGGGSLVQTSGGTFCNDGDGALASCPCANPGDPGTGCDNAQSTGGAQLALTSQGVSSATLTTSNLPPMSSPGVVLIRATTTEATPVVFGDGLRCVGLQGFVRLGATQAASGVAAHSIGHGAGSGQFFYQAWHRNTPAGFCDAGAAFNLSNGVILVW